MTIKTKNLIYNILTSGKKTDDYTVLYKLILINSFLFFGAFAFVIISIEWIIYARLDFLTISLVACLSFLSFMYAFRKIENFDKIVQITSVIPFLCVLSFLMINKNNDLGILWAYICVMFTIFLNGYKRGIIIASVFYIFLALDIYFDYEEWVKVGWSTFSTIRFIITSILSIALASMSDYVFTSLQNKIRIQSETDFLTGVKNRRSLDESIRIELQRHIRHNFTLSLCILDIDNFKHINDTQGHSLGDKVLKDISQLIVNEIRGTDKFGRWGGEEFCILLPETKYKDAKVILERIREKISNLDFNMENSVTCSFGMVEANGTNLDFDKLISVADKELYKAKSLGKNMVCCSCLTTRL